MLGRCNVANLTAIMLSFHCHLDTNLDWEESQRGTIYTGLACGLSVEGYLGAVT